MKQTKLTRLCDLIRSATPSRIITEILKDGWENTGWAGQSSTTATQRRGLKRFAKHIRQMRLDDGSALWRIFGGGEVKRLPLP